MPSTATLTRDTTLCVSLAARPSNIGTRFHNFLYDELGLDFVYKAFAPADLEAAVAGIRGLASAVPGCRCRSRRPASRCSTSLTRRPRRSTR